MGAVVVGTGPGPFTGLRVGLVTAAAFADALGVPAYGVCSLDGDRRRLPEADDLLVAADARRHEVYWARYRDGVRVGGPAVGAPADVPTDGVERGGRRRRASCTPSCGRRCRGSPVRYPDALALVALAADRIAAAEPAPSRSTPLYLRRRTPSCPARPKTVDARPMTVGAIVADDAARTSTC